MKHLPLYGGDAALSGAGPGLRTGKALGDALVRGSSVVGQGLGIAHRLQNINTVF
jgi:hypothetical protein